MHLNSLTLGKKVLTPCNVNS